MNHFGHRLCQFICSLSLNSDYLLSLFLFPSCTTGIDNSHGCQRVNKTAVWIWCKLRDSWLPFPCHPPSTPHSHHPHKHSLRFILMWFIIYSNGLFLATLICNSDWMKMQKHINSQGCLKSIIILQHELLLTCLSFGEFGCLVEMWDLQSLACRTLTTFCYPFWW